MLAAQTEDDTAAQYAWCSGCALSDTSAVTRAEPNPDSLGFLNATDSACGHQKKIYIYYIIYYIYYIYIIIIYNYIIIYNQVYEVYQVWSNHTRHVDPEVDTNESRGQTGVAEPTWAACGSAKGSALEGFLNGLQKQTKMRQKKTKLIQSSWRLSRQAAPVFFYKKWRDRTIQINQRHKNGRICGLQNPESLQ